MHELIVDFITSLNGYGAAEGWPGWWGLQAPTTSTGSASSRNGSYTILMGANTYRLMSGFAAEAEPSESDETVTDEDAATPELAKEAKVVSTLQPRWRCPTPGWSAAMRSRLWQQ